MTPRNLQLGSIRKTVVCNDKGNPIYNIKHSGGCCSKKSYKITSVDRNQVVCSIEPEEEIILVSFSTSMDASYKPLILSLGFHIGVAEYSLDSAATKLISTGKLYKKSAGGDISTKDEDGRETRNQSWQIKSDDKDLTSFQKNMTSKRKSVYETKEYVYKEALAVEVDEKVMEQQRQEKQRLASIKAEVEEARREGEWLKLQEEIEARKELIEAEKEEKRRSSRKEGLYSEVRKSVQPRKESEPQTSCPPANPKKSIQQSAIGRNSIPDGDVPEKRYYKTSQSSKLPEVPTVKKAQMEETNAYEYIEEDIFYASKTDTSTKPVVKDYPLVYEVFEKAGSCDYSGDMSTDYTELVRNGCERIYGKKVSPRSRPQVSSSFTEDITNSSPCKPSSKDHVSLCNCELFDNQENLQSNHDSKDQKQVVDPGNTSEIKPPAFTQIPKRETESPSISEEMTMKVVLYDDKTKMEPSPSRRKESILEKIRVVYHHEATIMEDESSRVSFASPKRRSTFLTPPIETLLIKAPRPSLGLSPEKFKTPQMTTTDYYNQNLPPVETPLRRFPPDSGVVQISHTPKRPSSSGSNKQSMEVKEVGKLQNEEVKQSGKPQTEEVKPADQPQPREEKQSGIHRADKAKQGYANEFSKAPERKPVVSEPSYVTIDPIQRVENVAGADYSLNIRELEGESNSSSSYIEVVESVHETFKGKPKYSIDSSRTNDSKRIFTLMSSQPPLGMSPEKK